MDVYRSDKSTVCKSSKTIHDFSFCILQLGVLSKLDSFGLAHCCNLTG